MQDATSWGVKVGQAMVSARLDSAEPASGTLMVCAHGAGGRLDDRGMSAASGALRAAGFNVLRFNFLYSEARSGRPDPMPRLMETAAAVVEDARRRLQPARTIIGGRSMGGRAFSMLAADGFACDGLLLLAYPLHPPGQTQKLRDAHLPGIRVPVLCFNGTRDTFCERPLMERVLGGLGANWTMHWLEGADHGFHVLKRSGRSDSEVLAEVAGVARGWAARNALIENGAGGH